MGPLVDSGRNTGRHPPGAAVRRPRLPGPGVPGTRRGTKGRSVGTRQSQHPTPARKYHNIMTRQKQGPGEDSGPPDSPQWSRWEIEEITTRVNPHANNSYIPQSNRLVFT